MIYIITIAAIAAIISGSVYVARRSDGGETTTIDPEPKTRWWSRRKRPPRTLSQWILATNRPEAPALASWYNNLSHRDKKRLRKQLEAFCKEYDLKLAWVVRGQLTYSTAFRQSAEATVINYLRAVQHGTQSQAHAALHDRFRKWQRRPLSRKNRPITQKLFDTLQQSGVIEPMPSNLLLARNRKRSRYVASTLLATATADEERFHTHFKQIVDVEN